MSDLLRDQLWPLLDQAIDDGPDGADLIELFEVLDEQGAGAAAPGPGAPPRRAAPAPARRARRGLIERARQVV